MHNGTPSITTTIGAEGMHDGLEFAGCIADDAPTFADMAVELFLNRTTWDTAQNNGRKIINTNYNAQVLEELLLRKIGVITENIARHRTQNVIGQLLLHQSMASTKYMAKWIEQKNRA